MKLKGGVFCLQSIDISKITNNDLVIISKATTYPQKMCMREAMKQPNKAQFIKSIFFFFWTGLRDPKA